MIKSMLYTIMKYRKAIGYLLVLIGVLFGGVSMEGFVYGPSDYWCSPALCISCSVILPLFAFLGTFLLCTSGGNRRLKLIIPGSIVTVLCIAGWITAITMAISIRKIDFW